MRIDAETVRQLADLAKLEFDAPELERMIGDLDEILGYVEKLSELDTRDVPPTTHVLGLVAPKRPDAASDVLSPDDALRNSPRRRDTSLVVPQVKEE